MCGLLSTIESVVASVSWSTASIPSWHTLSWEAPVSELEANCQHGPSPRVSYSSWRWQPRQSQPTATRCLWICFSSSLTKCLPFLAVFSTVPRPLLSEYPDQPLLLPPSFLRHHSMHGGKAWGVTGARRAWRCCFSQSSFRRMYGWSMTPSGKFILEKRLKIAPSLWLQRLWF